MSEAFTIWFTGISRSGKAVIAGRLAALLRGRNLPVEVLDSGRLRKQINRSLGFTRQEIVANTLRLGYECKLLNRNGVIAIVVAVSPYRDVRDTVRDQIGRFIEVYCRCPMEVLMKRDEAGLFQKAMRGEIEHVAGINAPYEEPFKPEVLLNTDQISPDEAARKIVTTLEILGFIDRMESAAYTPEEEQMIHDRLRDLGYL